MGKLLQKAKNAIEKDAKKVEDSVKHAASSAASVVKSTGAKIEDEVKTAETAVSRDAKAVIGGIKDDIQTGATKISDTARSAEATIKSDVGKIVSGAKQFAQELPTKLSAAGNYLEDAVLSAADTIGKAEDAILPDTSSIITETGLIVAAIVAVAIVAFKVV